MMEREMSATLSVKDAAERLGYRPIVLYGAIKRGEVPCIRIGHTIRIATAWVESQLKKAAG
jgi:excisionase family DNA binding protein